MDEFNVYRTNLDILTTGGRGIADLTPAYVIYERLIERIQQHVDYVNELLKQDKFKFTADETIQIDRRHAPFPADLDAAKSALETGAAYVWVFAGKVGAGSSRNEWCRDREIARWRDDQYH